MTRECRFTVRLADQEIALIKAFADEKHLIDSVALRWLIALGLASEARSRPQCKRNQVWFRLVAFPDLPAFIGTSRVEVPQAGIAQPIGRVIRLQRLFEERL